MENAFRNGEIKTAGTDIDKLMPPIFRFGGGGRAKKKKGVIDKLVFLLCLDILPDSIGSNIGCFLITRKNFIFGK